MGLTALLAGLERNDIGTAVPALRGVLVPAAAGRIRLAVRDLVFEFAADDVLDIDEDDDDRVTVQLGAGARLLGVEPIAAYRALVRGRRPFALSVRRELLLAPPNVRFAAREREFLRQRGLDARS